MWVAAGLLTRPWRHALLYDARWPWIPAVFLFACGFYIYSRAHLSFDQLIGRPEVQGQADDQGLVMTGIHARVRHPVYLGHLCELLGWSLGTGLVVVYGLTIFAVLTGAIMISLEERELEQRFGVAYRDYKTRVPSVIPKFSASASELERNAHS
jgi:protein-S-isoprenylcysteine O-methyltransferase Ste14